jgi:SprT-like protein
MLTVAELAQYANNFLAKNYSMELRIPIERNNRFSRTLGCFTCFKGAPEKIELSGTLLKFGADSVVLDVLYHELIHYALFTKGEPYKDGTVNFENELRKHGVTSTETSCDVGEHLRIKCGRCSAEILTSRLAIAKYPSKYRSSCCKTQFIVIEKVILDGTEESQ